MALHVQCPQSGVSAYVDCSCPPGYDPAVHGHLPACSHANLGAQVACPPAAGCCAEGHDHDAAANACAGGHVDACPEPAGRCRLWHGHLRTVHHAAIAAGEALPDDPCPGGHCHKDIKGCTVCHPLVITVMPGTTLQRTGA